APELAGYAAGTLWALLILIPSIGSRYLMRFVMREQYENACRLSRLLAFLHPADGWSAYPKILSALSLAKRGDLRAASNILAKYRDIRSPMARTAMTHFFR